MRVLISHFAVGTQVTFVYEHDLFSRLLRRGQIANELCVNCSRRGYAGSDERKYFLVLLALPVNGCQSAMSLPPSL